MTDPKARGYLFEFEAYGLPGPQGSKSPTGRYAVSQSGRRYEIQRESSKKVKPWRAAVKAAGEVAVAKHPTRHIFPLDGPLVGYVVFTLPRPQRKKADEAPAADRVPDVSKLLRSSEDALKDVVWTDDARVVGYDFLWKSYPTMHRDALAVPGMVMRVRRATHADLGLDPESQDGLKYQRLLSMWASREYAAARVAATQRAAVARFLGGV